MDHLGAFRDPEMARALVGRIQREVAGSHVRLMEFCGGHTHAIARYGIGGLLQPHVELLAGPGCPVCVTSATDIDRTLALAQHPNVTVLTFGDMMRVPGSGGRSLERERARGADVRVVYSPLDALDIAASLPERDCVLVGVGFETTAPGVAAAMLQAETRGIANFYLLSLHKLTPPAMQAILDADEVRLDGVIGPGHVSVVTGSKAWQFLVCDHQMPVAVAGFEPLDILGAVASLVEMAVSHRPNVCNDYARAVTSTGNAAAQEMMARCFMRGEAEWRGFGMVPDSGLLLREELAHRDAARVFDIKVPPVAEPPGCRCGDVLRGVLKPQECSLFGRACTPRNPIGPCMVSGEGSCAAAYQYRRVEE